MKISLMIAFAIYLLSFANLPLQAWQGSLEEPVLRPNFVFAIADDWGWPHASAYGDKALKTPAFDAVAARGALFQHAFVSSPSCSPSRGAIISGQHFWRLGEAANLWSVWPDKTIPEYPHLLEQAGYFIGHYRKAWGPGKFTQQPAGPRFKNPEAFFAARPSGQPFCFWFGAFDPHRGYQAGSGKDSGIPLNQVHLFGHFPDTLTVRNDVADYYFEVERFDQQLGKLLERLTAMNEIDNTIVVVTGDHGMPFPRCKTNLYDSGTRVPLAIQGPGIPGGRTIEDFVSLTDIAPTFLSAAGIPVPQEMTGKSLLPLLRSHQSGQIDKDRNHVIFGRERHTVSQEKGNRGGYPMRGLRNDKYLYIRNYYPERWPSGTPDPDTAEFRRAWLSDCDNGPTKTNIWDMRETPAGRKIYDLSFGKRPAQELYDLAKDPEQLVNVAGQAEYSDRLRKLDAQLRQELADSQDPRAANEASKMDQAGKYLGGGGGQWKDKKMP